MSSTEQAPEPTMDEILASIRKIISDDEPDQSLQPHAVASEAAVQADSDPFGEAAGASAQTAGQAGPADISDDILDLTQAIDPQVSPPQASAPQSETFQDEFSDTPGSEQAGDAAPAAPQVFATESDIASLLAEAGVQGTVSEPAPGAAEASTPTPEETSISEALSAMDQPAPAPQPEADASMEEDELMAPPEPAAAEQERDPFAMAPAAPEPAAQPADEQAAQALSDFGDVSAEAPVAPAVEEAAPEPEPEPEEADEPGKPEDDFAPAAAAEAESDGEDEAAEAPTANGKVKSLEDSVKEMLRPMLREWLDDNMERIVHNAVRDEVDSDRPLGRN